MVHLIWTQGRIRNLLRGSRFFQNMSSNINGLEEVGYGEVILHTINFSDHASFRGSVENSGKLDELP